MIKALLISLTPRLPAGVATAGNTWRNKSFPLSRVLSSIGYSPGGKLLQVFRIARGVRGIGVRRTVLLAGLTLRHLPSIARLRSAPPGSTLHRLLHQRPELWSNVLTPLVSNDWDAPTRFRRIADHCAAAQSLGLPFDIPVDGYVRLFDLHQIVGDYHVMIDQPQWMLRDGLLTLSLWQGTDRLYSLSFCLSFEEGQRIAYVGGVQGRKQDGMLCIYRTFTKAAHGVRPRDMIVELFRMLCDVIGIDKILGVSDAYHYQRGTYVAQYAGCDKGDLINYDTIWTDRGGTIRDDGFFFLSPKRTDRPLDTVPANKRCMYRKRYAMLEEIAQDMRQALAAARHRPVHMHAA